MVFQCRSRQPFKRSTVAHWLCHGSSSHRYEHEHEHIAKTYAFTQKITFTIFERYRYVTLRSSVFTLFIHREPKFCCYLFCVRRTDNEWLQNSEKDNSSFFFSDSIKIKIIRRIDIEMYSKANRFRIYWLCYWCCCSGWQETVRLVLWLICLLKQKQK